MKRKLPGLLFALALCMGLLCVSACAEPVDTWDRLSAAMGASGTVELANDVMAGPADTCLTVPAGVEVTLELNGHTVDRSLTAPQAEGYVIEVKGSLTVKDSVGCGAITGGNNSGSGGGVYVAPKGTFTMEGGSITGNTACDGGGVYAAYKASFTMTGGSISGNAASDGGGVYVSSDTGLTMSGGSIAGNTASDRGGGVYLDSSAFTMSNSACITGNTAVSGGGVWVASAGVFKMENGTIADNTANNTGFLTNGGGGVYVSGGTFTMDGGVIIRNRAVQTGSGETRGGGINVAVDGTFQISGMPNISGNQAGGNADNVYLPNGKTIEVTGPLCTQAWVGITTETAPADGLPVEITSSLNGAQVFRSDDELYGTAVEGSAVYLYRNPVVTFEANGGTGEMEPQLVPYGSAEPLNQNRFTRSGWSFVGWNTKADGTGVGYGREDTQVITLTEDLTLYAQWEQDQSIDLEVSIADHGGVVGTITSTGPVAGQVRVIAAWYSGSGQMLAVNMQACPLAGDSTLDFSIGKPETVGSYGSCRVFLTDENFRPLCDFVPLCP